MIELQPHAEGVILPVRAQPGAAATKSAANRTGR